MLKQVYSVGQEVTVGQVNLRRTYKAMVVKVLSTKLIVCIEGNPTAPVEYKINYKNNLDSLVDTNLGRWVLSK